MVRFGFGYLKDGSVRFRICKTGRCSLANAVLDGSGVCPVNLMAFSDKLYRDYVGIISGFIGVIKRLMETTISYRVI